MQGRSSAARLSPCSSTRCSFLFHLLALLLSLFCLSFFFDSAAAATVPPPLTLSSSSTGLLFPRQGLQQHHHSTPRHQEKRALGNTCVPYTGAPATGGKCDYVVGPAAAPYPANVYLRGMTMEQADEATSAQTSKMGAYFPPSCRTPLLALTCMGSFPHCRFTDGATFTVFPPCRSMCEAVVAGCYSFFESQNMLSMLPNCDMIDNSTGTPFPAFPPDYSGQCLVLPSSVDVPYSQVDCPYPLRFNYDDEFEVTGANYDPENMCIMPCPNPMWTASEWDGAAIFMMVFAGISFFLSSFVLITLCLLPTKRRYPSVLYIYITFCSMMVAFCSVFFPLVSGGPTRMVCTRGHPSVEVTFDNAREFDGAGVPCVIQGTLILYFALAAVFWWLALCISIFEMLFLGHSVHRAEKWHLFYHGFAWGAPLVAIIIGLGGTSFGAVPATPYCFVAGNEWWQWSLFFIPSTLTLLSGSVLVLISIVRFIRVRFRFKGQEAQKVTQVVRLLLLIVMYWLLLAYPLAFRIYSRTTQDDLEDAVKAQVACSAASGKPCELSERLNVGAWFLAVLSLGVHGFVIFSGITSWDMLVFLWTINKLLYTRPWREAIAEIREMVGGSNSSSANQQTRSKSSRASRRMQSMSPKESRTTTSAGSDSMSLSDETDEDNDEL